MTPVEFLPSWTLLLPPPNKNLVHYYGALAPRSPLRPLLVAKAEKEADRAALREKIDKVKKKAGSWVACLARVFEVYPLVCPRCGLEMKPVVVILNDKELVRLLTPWAWRRNSQSGGRPRRRRCMNTPAARRMKTASRIRG